MIQGDRMKNIPAKVHHQCILIPECVLFEKYLAKEQLHDANMVKMHTLLKG